MTLRTLTLTATNSAGSATASAAVNVADPLPTGTLTFTAGVPKSIDVSALIDPAAERTQGGYFYAKDPYDGKFFDHLWFDPAKKTFEYDGAPLNASNSGTNPNPAYWIGSEVGPHNTHWQWPPTIMKIPPQAVGQPFAIQGTSKHTRPRFCPRDNLIHIFGGDYPTSLVIKDGHQDGRMTFPNWNPLTNEWGLNLPILGRAGEDQLLSPDIMGYTYDEARELWWMPWGDSRAGVPANSPADDPTAIAAQCWSSLGGLSTAWPKSCTGGGGAAYDDQWPLFVFDLKAGKFRKLANLPWKPAYVQMREAAYDGVSKRLYMMRQGSVGIRLHILDTTLYETDPMNMPWSYVDVDLHAGKPSNLTGTGKYLSCWGVAASPLNIDKVKRCMYFFDNRNCAVLALTLQAHPLGQHKVQLVADLSAYMRPLDDWGQGYLAAASMPFIWCDGPRVLVLLREPLYQHVGPEAVSLTIDVDTGAVSAGPRFPSRVNGLPWFPGAGCWIPTTQELFLMACYNDTYGFPNFVKWGATPPTTAMQEMYRYKWNPAGTAPAATSPWKWKQLTVAVTTSPTLLAALTIADETIKRGPNPEDDHQ